MSQARSARMGILSKRLILGKRLTWCLLWAGQLTVATLDYDVTKQNRQCLCTKVITLF